MLRYPGVIPRDTVIDASVSLLDLNGTFLDYLGFLGGHISDVTNLMSSRKTGMLSLSGKSATARNFNKMRYAKIVI
jgi:hypothetical protein